MVEEKNFDAAYLGRYQDRRRGFDVRAEQRRRMIRAGIKSDRRLDLAEARISHLCRQHRRRWGGSVDVVGGDGRLGCSPSFVETSRVWRPSTSQFILQRPRSLSPFPRRLTVRSSARISHERLPPSFRRRRRCRVGARLDRVVSPLP